MLPETAVTRLGLGLADISPALSFGLKLDANGVATDVEVVPSWVRVQRLSYEEVDARLDEEPFGAFTSSPCGIRPAVEPMGRSSSICRK